MKNLYFVLLLVVLVISPKQMLNAAEKSTLATATITTKSCNNLLDSATVTLIAEFTPYNVYTKLSDTNGVVVFDSLDEGFYTVSGNKNGFNEIVLNSISITDGFIMDIQLSEEAYPVRNLYVDPASSIVTWDAPLITALSLEGFEKPDFPPPGWQTNDENCDSWKRGSSDDPMMFWSVPDWDSYYAIYNDEFSSGCSPYQYYLITPSLDLTGSTHNVMYYDRFFNSLYGGAAMIQYTIDDGATWEVLSDLMACLNWHSGMLDLSYYSGENGFDNIKLAFVYWGYNADGFVVDNVEVVGDSTSVISYDLFLDNVFVATLPPDQTTYTFQDLVYGQNYTATVRVNYACNVSEPVSYSWQSAFLYPPRNVSDGYVYNTSEVPIFWNPPVKCIPDSTAMDINQKNTNSRSQWDLQFSWTPQYNDGEQGIETDGSFIYTSKWDGDRFSKYTLDGEWLEDFTISGVSNIRDLTYDGTCFYGGAGDFTVYKMDFENHTLVGTFQAPVEVNAIAYNEDSETFFASNLNSDVYEFTMNGTTVSSFSLGGSATISGMAYDKWSSNGPYLWLYNQGQNNIMQVQLPEGTLTGETVDVQSITGATGVAGGLFSQPDLIQGTVTIGGLAVDNMVWGLELALSPLCYVPYGLLSYNVYRDQNLIENIPYNNEPKEYQYSVVSSNLSPGTYCFQVSALYDLGDYGFPGDVGESAPTTCHEATVIWGKVLPFTEQWDMGSMEFNDWNSDDGFWVVDNEIGNDAPSVQFSAQGLENGYESLLTSTFFRGDSLAAGKVWLDFNLKLDDLSQSGNEHLYVQVYKEGWWYDVFEIANNGSFDFEEGFNHVDISQCAFGNIFRVRFNANGQNSSDIASWFVDNISIYRSCQGPKNLNGEYYWDGYNNFGALLCWEFYISDLKTNSRRIQTEPSGFELYRSACCPDGGYDVLAFIPYDETKLYYCYKDTAQNIPLQEPYWYKIRAIWPKDGDVCESAYANSKLIPENDYVEVLITGVGSKNENDGITIYPNPAKDMVFISSHEPISRITVFDFSGKVVADLPVNNKTKFELSTTGLNAGVYMVRVNTKKEEVVERVVIVP